MARLNSSIIWSLEPKVSKLARVYNGYLWQFVETIALKLQLVLSQRLLQLQDPSTQQMLQFVHTKLSKEKHRLLLIISSQKKALRDYAILGEAFQLLAKKYALVLQGIQQVTEDVARLTQEP